MKSQLNSKIICNFVIALTLAYSYICKDDKTPTVSVNYFPKKQWKLSKHDISEIKLDIEREVGFINYVTKNCE